MLWTTAPLGLLCLLSSTTHPLLLCWCLSQRLPSLFFHILPSQMTVTAFLSAPWPALSSGGVREKPVVNSITWRSWPRWNIAKVIVLLVSFVYEEEQQLGAHDTCEVVEGKLLEGQAREQSWLQSLFLWDFHRCHLPAGLAAAFLRRDLLLGDLICPCFGPELHQVEGSSCMHLKMRLSCLKVRAGWLTHNRSETVLIFSF